MVNVKGELVLTSTSSTVFREECDESDISMELSQKQRDDFSHDHSKKWKSREPLEKIANIDQALNYLAAEEQANKQLAFIVKGDSETLNDPPLLGSTKQI